MKIGEIWTYIGNKDNEWDHFDNFPDGDDSDVRILDILKGDDVNIIYDDDIDEIDVKDFKQMEDLIEFSHLMSGAIGVLNRDEFVKLYKKVYK